MAAEVMVTVGYQGADYQVPKDVLNAGMAASYIEDQLAEKAERKAQREAKVQQSVETEFTTIKNRLGKLDELEAEQSNLNQVVESYVAANQALKAQIDALESSGTAAGSASAEARQVSFDLSNAATSGASLLGQLHSAQTVLDEKLDGMNERLAEFQVKQAKVLTDAAASAKTSKDLLQDAVARATDMAAKAEARAAEAEAKASRALVDAEASKNLGRNDVTRDQLLSMINAELLATTENVAEQVVAQIKDQFPQGPGGIRMDKEFMAQTRKDSVTAAEIRFGEEQAKRRARRKAQGFA
jgi:chromosome segregation ATPase